MKKVIKHPKKMKNAMYIVFGVFALALFAITRIHPSYANEGLMIDDALDAIVLYGEVDQLPEDEEVEEVQDEEIQEIEKNQEVEEEDIAEPEETSDEEIDEEETSEDLDETVLERDDKGIDKTENKEENHGVSDENGDNEKGKEEQKVEKDEETVNENKEGNVGVSEEFGFKSPENKIAEEVQPNIIESEEIYGTGEYEGVKVEVYAQTGLFASGTVLTIEPVIKEKLEQVKEVLSGEVEMVEYEEEQIVAFDITFRDPVTQEELQPKNGTVQVTFNYEENENLVQAEENEEREVKVYHLNDIDEKGEKIEELTGTTVEKVVVNEKESKEENVLVVEAEKFSVYTIVVQVKQEQLISFQYGMISIANPSNTNQAITIMDRNLGAESNDRTNPKSYGYHYQWGNNYGFDSNKSASEISTSSTKIDVSSKTEYSSSTFITGNTSWMTTNKNLWGEGGQGPCPEGWHVPTRTERKDLYTYYNNTYSSGANGFLDYFKIPFAGERRQYNAYVGSQSSNGYYWSSSPSSFDDYAYYFDCYSNNISPENTFGDRADGYSVRCFKNSPIDNSILHEITIDYRGGKGSVALINVEHGLKAQIPTTPTRRNSNFLGRYLSGTDTEFNFTGTTITEDITIYAKWSCKDGFIENNKRDGCVYVVPYNFNANGGYFSGEEINTVQVLQYFCSEFDCYTNGNLQNPGRVSDDISQQSGWMFAGWYMKSGENGDWGDEFNPKTATINTVYAKWLPFNDLSIKDGDKTIFTIMDRNLGAEMISTGYSDTVQDNQLGFYYQWGNNYGFSNDLNNTIPISKDTINVESYGPRNYYSSSVYRIGNYNRDSSNNGNLWGGSGDTLNSRGEGTDEDRQGPCPSGYHIPSILEWKMAVNAWKNLSSKSIDQDSEAKNFSKDLLLPFAGYSTYDAYYYNKNDLVWSKGRYANYWSSSSIERNAGHIGFNSSSISNTSTDYKSYGLTIRCFKNVSTTNKKLKFMSETGNVIVQYDLKRWESITSDYRPENPTKQGYEFIGRYESGSNEEYDFSQDRTNDLTLYEKWALIDINGEKDTAKLMTGINFNAIIKTLAKGERIQYSAQDTMIEGIERSSMFPEGGNKRLISSEDSEAQIFAWYDEEDKKIKYYTKAKDIYLNEDSSYTFYSLRNLKSFNVNDFKTDYVKNMEKMFAYSFSSANELIFDFTKMNLKNVTNMSKTFEGSFQDGEISGLFFNFSGMDLSNVTTMQSMFNAAFEGSRSKVEKIDGIKIDFTNANLNSVENMEGMFEYGIKNAKVISNVLIDFTNAKLKSAKNMKYMFNSMFQSVTTTINGITINLNNIDLENIEDMRYMFEYSFEYNNGIQNISGVSINIKNSVINHEVNVNEMFQSMFYQNGGGIINGIRIDFSNSNLNGLKDMNSLFRGAFGYNNTLSGVVIDFSDVKMNQTLTMNNMFENCFRSNGNLNGIIIDFGNAETDSLTNMTKMFYDTFQEVGNITGVNFNFNGMNLSNLETMDSMFYNSFTRGGNITGVVIDFSDLDLRSLTSTSNMFNYTFTSESSVNGITINFNNADLRRLENMSKMFYYTFYNAGNVNGLSIDISNTNLDKLTNITEIFSYMFYNINSANDVYLGFHNASLSSLTSSETMFGNMFYGAKSVSGVVLDLSNANFDNLTNANEMFRSIFNGTNNINGLKIDLSNVDFSSLENLKRMFHYAIQGSNNIDGVIVDFTNTDFSSVQSASKMFQDSFKNYSNIGAISLIFDKINMHNVTDMSNMFWDCNSLKWLDLSSFDTSNVTDMTYMFYSCKNLTGLDLSSFDTSNVTKMPYMFQDNFNLETIYVSSRFRTNNVTNSSVMFQNDTKLVGGRGTKYESSNPRDKTYARIDRVGEPGYFTKKSEETVAILLPGQEFNAKIKTIAKGSSASYRDADIYIKRIKEGTKDEMLVEYLERGTLEKVSTTDSEKPIYAWYSDNDKTLYYYSEADVIDMNTDATNMFSNLTKLEEFDLEGIETRGVTIMSGMFMNDSSLVELNFENRNLGSVKNIQNMFNGCSNLEKINFSNADMQSITGFNGVFTVLPKLEEIKFSNANLRNLKSTNGMFGGSSNLEYADFSDADMRKVIDMISMFGGNSKLKKVNFSNANLRNLNSVNSMFGGSSLQYANFDDANMPKLGNMSSMFGGCGNLTGVTFSGTKLGNVTDMSYMFGGDSKLREVIITDKLTKLESAYEMFGGCSGLTGIDLSNFEFVSLTNLQGMFDSATNLKFINFGNNDFKNATNLKDIFLNCSNLEEINLSKFDTSNVTNMKNMFKNATNLKTIYIGDNFSTENVTESTDMFLGAVALVGGNGTTYDENHIDKEYARADKSGTPGYFMLGEFSIIYNLEGGDMEDMKTSYKLGESFVIGQPTKEENIFLGWTGSNGNTPELVVEIQQGTIGDLEFTANWKVNQYKIIFDTDGGNAINPIVIDYNSLLTGINLQTPTKECNEFSGWNIELPERMPAHDITLKAVWNYTCSKSSGGGGGGGGGSSTVKTKDDKDNHGVADEEKNINLEKEENKSIEIQDNQVVEDKNNQETTQKVDDNNKKEVDTETVVESTTTSNNSSYTSEQKQSYEFAKSNGITTTSSIEQAKMNTSLTRIEMAKMLSYYAINVLGQEPDAEKGVVKFSDVTNKLDKEYDNGVTLAYQLGIMGQNMPNNKFRPNDEVTRAEFATALSRLLYNTDEGEYKGTRKYYEPHIAKLYNEGIINKTDPKMKEKRGYVMIMLMRTAQ